MSAEPKFVDLDDEPELGELADEVSATRQPIVVRRHGRELAVISPLGSDARPTPYRPRTPEDLEAFMRSAGGWRGIVDEDFIAEVYRSRTISSRPPVEL